MDIHPIKTEADYHAALREVSPCFENEPEPGTPEGDRFDILLTLIEAYEAKHHPIDAPDPIEAIKYLMEAKGLERKYLAAILGSRQRVHEILERKRPLSMQQIRKLHDSLGIPAEVLIKPYPLAKGDALAA